MSAFRQPFLFLRDPRGGVEDVTAMNRAGFAGVFCNIGDFPPSDWETVVRPRALQQGMFCGPWLRTQASDGGFSVQRLNDLVATADRWGSPLVVNSESELKGSGDTLTKLIAGKVAGRDAAVSMEPQPFADTAWWPLENIPVLPQVFGPSAAASLDWYVGQWHAYGVRCVYPTFGTFGGALPSTYPLNAPYSLYAADDCGGNFAAWKPTADTYNGCEGGPVEKRGAAQSSREAWDAWLESTAKPDAWRRDNPGEWKRLQAYWDAPAGTPAPDGIRSATGRMLLRIAEARRWAEGSHA